MLIILLFSFGFRVTGNLVARLGSEGNTAQKIKYFIKDFGHIWSRLLK